MKLLEIKCPRWLVKLEVLNSQYLFIEKMEHAKEAVKDAAGRAKEKMQDKKVFQ